MWMVVCRRRLCNLFEATSMQHCANPAELMIDTAMGGRQVLQCTELQSAL